MKSIGKIVSAICCMTLAAVGTSCHLDPYELPEEEIYLRNFIKKYGLIDPEQEWNESKETVVSVELGSRLAEVTVFVSNLDKYYRVAYYVNAKGTLEIPIDIPKDTQTLYVMVDDDLYTTRVGGNINATVPPEARSRQDGTDLEIENAGDLKWILVAEDLGVTDDFDFNDIVVGISAVTLNEEALSLTFASEQWQVIRTEEHLTLENVTPGTRSGSRADNKNYKMLQIYPLAAGGTLPLYLHYKSGDIDYIIGGESNTDAKNMTALLTEETASNYEWHRWFGDRTGRLMINTGLNDGLGATKNGTPVTIVVDDNFTMTNYSRKYIDENNNNTSGPGSANGALKGDKTKYPDEYNNSYTDIFGFYITVSAYSKEQADKVLAAPVRGSAPHMFLIPDFSNHADGKWHWPMEFRDITEVYPLFSGWVTGQTHKSWYNNLSGTEGTEYYHRDSRF